MSWAIEPHKSISHTTHTGYMIILNPRWRLDSATLPDTGECKEPDSLETMFQLTISDPGRPAAPRGRRVAVTKEHQLPGLQPPAVTSVGHDSITLTFPCHVVIVFWVAQLLLFLGAFQDGASQSPLLWRHPAVLSVHCPIIRNNVLTLTCVAHRDN